MNGNFTPFVFLIFFIPTLNAQKDHETQHDPAHGHDLHKNELGLAIAPVYFLEEEVVSLGLHMHYIRKISDSGFGIGAGYERIFDEHGHNTFGLLMSYRPADRLALTLSPGVTIEDEDPGHASFALHIEGSYEFELGNFHVGPVVELAYDPEDIHLSVGLHIGIGF
jgi:hypothetical protein